jgi:ribosomal protein L40E
MSQLMESSIKGERRMGTVVICPSCKAENVEGALTCDKCGSSLPDSRASLFRPPTGLLTRSALAFEPRIRDHHVGKLTRNDIAVYIADMEDPLIIPVARDLVMGRFGGVDAEFPATIDLAPYNAIECGVSRRHALLRRLGPDVVIIDLESTNGTWLNGVPVKPHEPITIRSGDRVLLARMMLQVYLPGDE